MYKGNNFMNLDGFSLIDDQKKDIYSYMNEFPDDKDFEKTVKKYAKPLKDYQELLNLERTVRRIVSTAYLFRCCSGPQTSLLL